MAAAATYTPLTDELPRVLDKVIPESAPHQQLVLFDESTIATLLPDLLPGDHHFGWQLYPSLPKVYIAGDTSDIVNHHQLERATHRRKAPAYTTRVRRATGEVDTLVIRCGGYQSNETIGRGASMDVAVLPTTNGSSRSVSDDNVIEWTRYALPYSVDTTQVTLAAGGASPTLDVTKAIHSRKNYGSVVVNNSEGLGEWFIVMAGWWGNTDPNKGGWTTTCDAFHIPTRTWYPTATHASSRINVIDNGAERSFIDTKDNFIPNLPGVSPTATQSIGAIVYVLSGNDLYSLDTSGMTPAITNKTPFVGEWIKLASSHTTSIRTQPSLLVWRDTLLLIGGTSGVATAEHYSPNLNVWRYLSFAPPPSTTDGKEVDDFSPIIVRTPGGRDILYAVALYHNGIYLNECYAMDITDEYHTSVVPVAASKWAPLPSYRYDAKWPVAISPILLPYEYFSRVTEMPVTA